jgi:peptidoglycan/LPS O-acetylase OafA/YrhL
MRAIAALTVVGLHTAVAGQAVSASIPGRLLAHLNIGVTIFFLISGFLLYRPFIAHRAGGAAAPRARDYTKRRILRIYPAYWVVLTVLVLVPGLTGVSGGHLFGMYALLHTLPIYHGAGCVAFTKCGLAQTWSLVVEVTFYVMLPLYALVMARLTRGLRVRSWMRVELFLLAGLSAISTALEYVVFKPPPRWLDSTALGYAFWFALGMGMAVVSVGLGDRQRQPWPIRQLGARPVVPWLMALATYVLLCAWLPATPFLVVRSQLFVLYIAFGLIAALLLAPAVFGGHAGGVPRRLLAHPVMAWLGLISYGIFLWHYAVTIELGLQGARRPMLLCC